MKSAQTNLTNVYVWQDRDIKFDSKQLDMVLCPGETVVDEIPGVEDTQGNNGERGSLSATNLRILWECQRNPRINLSIGYNCIASVSIKKVKSRLRGNVQALYVVCKSGASRFQFVFTCLIRNSPRLFSSILSVVRSYETSRMFRDIKLRGAILKDSQLVSLPNEHIINKISGIWNLSTDQGCLGYFIITSIRIIWYSAIAGNFNASIPYLQVSNIKTRQSKFGLVLIIETFTKSGGYVLGFKSSDEESLKQICEEITNLHQVYSSKPDFGIEFQVEDTPPAVIESIPTKLSESTFFSSSSSSESSSFRPQHYLTHQVEDATMDISQILANCVYDSYTGLTVVSPPSPLQDMWRLV